MWDDGKTHAHRKPATEGDLSRGGYPPWQVPSVVPDVVPETPKTQTGQTLMCI
jgi:hypothetical protein